jgi:hypothetical protein
MRPPRSWILLHAGFAALAAVGLLMPVGSLGMRVLALVIIYNVAVVVLAKRTGDALLWRMWAVLAPMSVLMLLPDWFLGAVLGTITFPDTGSPFIGTMPWFMAGMWTIALLPPCLLGRSVEDARGPAVGFLTAAAAGMAVFIAAEFLAPAIPLWEPVGVTEVAGVAVYVLLPELGLCLATYALVRQRLNLWATAGGIVAVPFMYLGMLATSYQFIG